MSSLTVRRALAAVLTAALALTALGLPSAGPTPFGPSPAAAQEDFYTPPSPLPSGENGDVIRSQRVSRANATATRIMYLSRDVRNRPMAVTGTVLVPNTPWPGGGPRPIVAYAPFTAGMGDQCAVSRLLAGESWGDFTSGAQTAFVDALLAKGIAVAQTDYQGLGTPGDHTYVMRLPQAHATLDVIRAAQRLPGTGLPADGPVGIAGYSQGGGAAAAAAELASTYAPELDVQGVYVGAPTADLAAVARSLDGGFYAGFVAFALIGANAAYPELDIPSLANEQGRQVLREANTLCTFDAVLRYAYRQTSTLTADGRPVSAYLAEEPYSLVVSENRLGTIRPAAPTLVEHSSLDDVLPFAQGRQLARDWCGRGANVQFRDLFTFIPLFVHLLQASTAATNAANWLAGRFQGTAPAPNCGGF
ncbi:MAG TPA: lipase family protein [Acidimicrobiales bacterium]